MTRRDFLIRSVMAFGAQACFAKLPRNPASAAMRAGAGFLTTAQSADGAWRSSLYGAFGDGDVLTPLVLWALVKTGNRSGCAGHGLEWLTRLADQQKKAVAPWDGLNYPLFTAAYSAQVFAAIGDGRRATFWAGVVERFRIHETLGWPAKSPACGAWSDASSPPLLPLGTVNPPDMLAPNISATVLGLQAMAGTNSARLFVEQCQNFAEPGSDLDDGGFFFAPGDSIRNKAGVAGHDVVGERYRSYGSATCDGVLAMHACGMDPGEPRMRAGLNWLRRRTEGLSHAGNWPADRADDRDSLIYYYAQSLAAVLAIAARIPEYAGWAGDQTRALATDLAAKQKPDGSWAGEQPNSFEDDPLVSTAFAISALADARSEI